MSELKAIRSGEIYDIIEYEDCYRTDDLYYPKSEADHCISKLIADQQLELDEWYCKVQHHKYKRCLAMARWCGKNIDYLNSEGYIYEKTSHTNELADCIRRAEFYHRWYKRWLELAERFK